MYIVINILFNTKLRGGALILYMYHNACNTIWLSLHVHVIVVLLDSFSSWMFGKLICLAE